MFSNTIAHQVEALARTRHASVKTSVMEHLKALSFEDLRQVPFRTDASIHLRHLIRQEVNLSSVRLAARTIVNGNDSQPKCNVSDFQHLMSFTYCLNIMDDLHRDDEAEDSCHREEWLAMTRKDMLALLERFVDETFPVYFFIENFFGHGRL